MATVQKAMEDLKSVASTIDNPQVTKSSDRMAREALHSLENTALQWLKTAGQLPAAPPGTAAQPQPTARHTPTALTVDEGTKKKRMKDHTSAAEYNVPSG